NGGDGRGSVPQDRGIPVVRRGELELQTSPSLLSSEAERFVASQHKKGQEERGLSSRLATHRN
ncbi:unnamed protein product, partial [Ectocarpus sp. 12 AP-2014]